MAEPAKVIEVDPLPKEGYVNLEINLGSDGGIPLRVNGIRDDFLKIQNYKGTWTDLDDLLDVFKGLREELEEKDEMIKQLMDERGARTRAEDMRQPYGEGP